MRATILTAGLIVLSACAAAAQPIPAPQAAATAGPQSSPEMVAAIEAADQALFAIVFDSCDVEALRPILADEFEFIHDKQGVAQSTPDEFVASIRSTCEGRARGSNIMASRELVRETHRIYAIADNAAIQTGEHRFFQLTPGQPPQLRETGRFFHHWILVDGAWRLRRVYSYDHRPA